MARPRALLANVAALLALAAGIGLAHAGGASVAKVGSREVTAEELELRLASLMGWQLKGFGKTADEVRRAYLDRVVVRDAVLAQGAEAEGLLTKPAVEDRVRSLLRGALLSRVRFEATEKPITDEEVRAYYVQNRAKFSVPAKISLWRILVGTKAEAESILAEVKKDPKRWNDLAREKSLDKVTHMRGGNLGFVSSDGATGEAGITVDPAVFQAALGGKDGEILDEPVAEEGKWAVVWRRQSTPAVERTLEQEAKNIRQTLAFKQLDERIKALLDELKRKDLVEFRPELVDRIEVGPSSEVQPSKRPGALPTSRRLVQPAPGQPQPKPGPDGLR